MATKLGIIGPPNSGKSHGRTYLNGEEVMVIMPSRKDPFIYKKDGTPCDEFTISSKKVPDPVEFAKALGWKGKGNMTLFAIAEVAKMAIAGRDISSINMSGNYMMCEDLLKLPSLLGFISKFMTNIKVVCLADFTHYLSNYVKRDEFKGRTKGGGQYDKYVDMAVDTLDTFFSSSMDYLRDDLIIITEFHTEERENKNPGTIFVPAGNMLESWFKPESYFDILLGTKVLTAEQEPVKAHRYKYVTDNISNEFRYCRSANMFEVDEIPNDLSLVVHAIRERKKNRNFKVTKEDLDEQNR